MFYGWQNVSMVDYPGKIVSTLFTSGCNFRCPFCHNADLVNPNHDLNPISLDAIFAYLEKRRNCIDGICITGGEPTLQNDLIPFMQEVRNQGFLIKLDTNGSNPHQLQNLLPYVDYIAMDIKNSLEKYPQTIGRSSFSPQVILDSIQLIRSESSDYEFRTTLCQELHAEADIYAIGKLLHGAKQMILQRYNPSEKQLSSQILTAHPPDTLKQFQKILEGFIQKVAIRGI